MSFSDSIHWFVEDSFEILSLAAFLVVVLKMFNGRIKTSEMLSFHFLFIFLLSKQVTRKEATETSPG